MSTQFLNLPLDNFGVTVLELLLELCTEQGSLNISRLVLGTGIFEHGENIQQHVAPYHFVTGRQLCFTQKGYIGWISPDANKGDKVVAFSGP